MDMLLLKPSSGFIDPRVFRSLPAVGTVRGSAVVVLEESFDICVGALPEGTEVLVRVGQDFTARSTEDIRIEKEKYDREFALKQKRDELREAQRIERDRIWNEALCPFSHSVQIKNVLSGLSQRSCHQNGSRKNSVRHVYLHQDLSVGRFHRKDGQFLCSASVGAHYNELIDRERPVGGRISCKACLSRLAKIRGSHE